MSISALKKAVPAELDRTLRLSCDDSDTAIELVFLDFDFGYQGFNVIRVLLWFVFYLSADAKCTLLYSEKSPSHDHSSAIRCIFQSIWGVLIHKQFDLNQVKPVAII